MNINDLGKLAAQKEEEWKSATNLQIQSFQEGMEEKEEALRLLNEKYAILKRDFKYNLKLLEDRDKELKQYDTEYVKLKSFQAEYLNVISDLKIKISNLQQKLKTCEHSKSQMELEYRKQTNGYLVQIDVLKRNKSKELDEVRDKNFIEKNELERKIKFLENEIECQRMELIAELENINKTKELESREKWENKNAEILSHELRVKLLTKEMELIQTDKQNITDAVKVKDEEINKLRRNLEKAEFNAKDIATIKNSKIMELENTLLNFKSNQENLTKDFTRKHSELDKEIRLKQLSLDEARKAFLGKEHELKQKIFDLETKVKLTEQEVVTAVSNKGTEMTHLKQDYEQLKAENIYLKAEMDKHLSRISELTVCKDVEISKLNKDIEFLKRENKKSKKGVQENIPSKSDSLYEMENLIRVKNDLIQENNRLREQLLERENDTELQEKNAELQNVIQGMASEMQILSKTEANLQYITELETEVVELRKLKRHGVGIPVSPILPAQPPKPVKIDSNNPDIEQHILSLNKTIENLRTEKVGLNAQLRKQQVRIQHFEDRCNHGEIEKNKMSAKIQQLEYEISSSKKRYEQERLLLTNQIDALKLSLAESRKEADEYYKGGLDHNLMASELGNKISKMQLEFASTSNWVSSDSHKLLVTQLQNDNKQLRSELAHAKMLLILGDSEKTSGKLSSQLYEKLKEAANKISELMQANYKLEQEISKLKKSTVPTQDPHEKGDHVNVKPSKLNQLEDLQYELTKQELKFAQIDNPTHTHNIKPILKEESPVLPVKETVDKVPVKGSNTLSKQALKPVQMSIDLSSVGDPELKDVWGLLDDNLTSDNSNVQPASVAKPKNKKMQAPMKTKTLKKGKKPKIRNYNIRDSSS